MAAAPPGATEEVANGSDGPPAPEVLNLGGADELAAQLRQMPIEHPLAGGGGSRILGTASELLRAAQAGTGSQGINAVMGAMNSFRIEEEEDNYVPAAPEAKAEIEHRQKDSKVNIGLTAKKAQVLLQKEAYARIPTVVERDMLKLVIEEGQSRFAGCLMLPVTILFFLFYAGAASLHEDIAQTHLMQSPFRDTITPPLDPGEDPDASMLAGVTTVADFWTFLDATYVPTFFNHRNSYGDLLPELDRNRMFTYNNLVGAVVFEQQRSKAEPCDHELAEHITCFPQGKLSAEPFGRNYSQMPNVAGQTAFDYYRTGADPIIKCDNEGFSTQSCSSGTRRLEILRDELLVKMPVEGPEEDTYSFFVFEGPDRNVIDSRLQYLRQRGFFDIHTTQVKLKALIINNNLDIPRLMRVEIVFHQSRGGGLYATLRIEPINLKSYSRFTMVVFDACFTIMLIASTLFVMGDLCHAMCHRRASDHFTTVNCITWFTVLVGWINIGCFFGLAFVLRTDVIDKLEAVWQVNDEVTASALHQSADDFIWYNTWYRVLVADAHIIFMLRCFIALQYQPRLAVVTQTLKETSMDLAHFLVVFIPCLLAFSMAANSIFGRRVLEFSTVEGAISTTFRIGMESQFDWSTMAEEDFMTAATWAWIYMLLISLLMMNMVVAIIMDVYSVIRLQAGNSETIWSNIYYLCMRFWYMKSWVKDAVLLDRVEMMPRTVSIDELRTALPEITEYQLLRLVEGCHKKAQAVMRMGVHPSYTAQMAAATKMALDELSDEFKQLTHNGWLCKGVEAGDLTSRMLAQDVLQSTAAQRHWMKLITVQLEELRKKTTGVAATGSLFVSFEHCQGLPKAVEAFASCIVKAQPTLEVRTAAASRSKHPTWEEEEKEIPGYAVDGSTGLEFNVCDTRTQTSIIKVILPPEQYHAPGGFDDTLPFPGGELKVRVVLHLLAAETTV